jgi:hypothetical protein
MNLDLGSGGFQSFIQLEVHNFIFIVMNTNNDEDWLCVEEALFGIDLNEESNAVNVNVKVAEEGDFIEGVPTNNEDIEYPEETIITPKRYRSTKQKENGGVALLNQYKFRNLRLNNEEQVLEYIYKNFRKQGGNVTQLIRNPWEKMERYFRYLEYRSGIYFPGSHTVFATRDELKENAKVGECDIPDTFFDLASHCCGVGCNCKTPSFFCVTCLEKGIRTICCRSPKCIAAHVSFCFAANSTVNKTVNGSDISNSFSTV